MNGEFTRNAAQKWAQLINSGQIGKTPEQQITEIYQQAYARTPDSQELARCLTYLKEEGAGFTDAQYSQFKGVYLCSLIRLIAAIF